MFLDYLKQNATEIKICVCSWGFFMVLFVVIKQMPGILKLLNYKGVLQQQPSTKALNRQVESSHVGLFSLTLLTIHCV
jgi:hypothetical protein